MANSFSAGWLGYLQGSIVLCGVNPRRLVSGTIGFRMSRIEAARAGTGVVQPVLRNVLHHAVRNEIPDRVAFGHTGAAVGGGNGHGRDLQEADVLAAHTVQDVAGPGYTHEV